MTLDVKENVSGNEIGNVTAKLDEGMMIVMLASAVDAIGIVIEKVIDAGIEMVEGMMIVVAIVTEVAMVTVVMTEIAVTRVEMIHVSTDTGAVVRVLTVAVAVVAFEEAAIETTTIAAAAAAAAIMEKEVEGVGLDEEDANKI